MASIREMEEKVYALRELICSADQSWLVCNIN